MHDKVDDVVRMRDVVVEHGRHEGFRFARRFFVVLKLRKIHRLDVGPTAIVTVDGEPSDFPVRHKVRSRRVERRRSTGRTPIFMTSKSFIFKVFASNFKSIFTYR